MYERFYGLNEKPFQIVSNPDYLYLSPTHENALTYMEYGLMENVGFILLTGEVGAGKTTLVRHIMNRFDATKEIGVIFNTNVSVEELISLVMRSFELVPVEGNKTDNLERFHRFLIEKYADNKDVLLIIDEAQNLSDDALEEIRMLSNLQSDDQNLLQIMLVGQPELKNKLGQPRHSPFAQRIAVNFFLSGLTENETHAYIIHRLEKAGGRADLFNTTAMDMIFRASGGIPRSVNLLCDAALVYGFGYDLGTINADVIEQVIQDKGGMGIHSDEDHLQEDHRPALPQDTGNPHVDQTAHTENSVLSLRHQVAAMHDMLKNLEKRTGLLEEKSGEELRNLLLKERQRSDELLNSYAELKLKYSKLLKMWREKNKWSWKRIKEAVKKKVVK